MGRPASKLWQRYGVGVATVGVATAARLALDSLLGDQFPFLTYVVALVFAAWYGGFGPALGALAVSVPVAAYVFLPPRGSLLVQDPRQMAGLVVYGTVGLTISWLVGSMRTVGQWAGSSETPKMAETGQGGGHTDDCDVRQFDERFQLAAEAVDGFLYDACMRTGTEERTRGLEDVLGFRPAEVPSNLEWWPSQILPEDLPIWDEAIHQGLETSDRYMVRYRVRHRDGRILHVVERGVVRRDEQNRVVRRVGSIQDVSGVREIEDALVQSEQRLQLVIESADLGTFDVDLRSGSLDWSARSKALFGLPADASVTYKTFLKGLHPDDRPLLDTVVRDVFRPGSGVLDVEFRTVGLNGTPGRWVSARGRGYVDGAGRFSRFIGTVLDVTARKQAEQAVRRSEERFRQLAAALPQIVWIARSDFQPEYFNERWFEYTGLTNEESFHPDGWMRSVHPDDMSVVVSAMERTTDGSVPFEAEYRLRHHSGVYRWHLGRAVVSTDDTGRVVGRYGTATDIDDHKRAEHAARFLAEASATLAALVDEGSALQQVANLAVPFFADWCTVDLVGEDGFPHRLTVAHVDPSKIEYAHELHRRYPPNPDSAQGVMRVIRSGEPLMISEITDEMMRTSARDEEHLRILLMLGLRSYLCVPLKGRAGILGVISFVAAESGRLYGPHDLRLAEDLAHRAVVAIENARLYAALAEADRHKSEFLAMLAHELRNPLAPIRLAAHLLRTTPGVDEVARNEVEMVERQVVHLARLVDDLLDVSRISQGKIGLRKEVVDLVPIVRRTIEAMKHAFQQRGHELVMVLPEGPVTLEADATRLEQIVSNLLSNANKYTEPGGHIALTVESVEGQAILRVNDDGIGLAPEMLPKVFDLFVQVEPRSDRAQGGLGVGLSLVKTLVEMHGGSIVARSEGRGRGSEFIVSLPILTSTDSTSSGTASVGRTRKDDDADATPPTRRVLVVDDNQDAANSLAKLLVRLYGQEVRVAHDGFAALDAAEAFQPEIVLLDIGMPGLDGYEVARRLRARDGFADTLLVALTGLGQEADRRRSTAAGFNQHMVKPVDPEAILDLLSQAGARSRPA